MNRQLSLERNVKGVRTRTAGVVRPRVPAEDIAQKPPAAASDSGATDPQDGPWTTLALGDVAEIWNGATPSTQIPAYWNGTIPFVTPTDVTETSGKYLDATARRITEEGLSSCPARLLPVGTILVCSRATIGEIKIATAPLCTNQGFKSLVCREAVSNEFVYYLLLTLKPKMVRRATGSTFLEIDRRQIASIEAKFPPPAEQHAVAGALSDIDGLLKALRALIAKKRATTRATMQRLLTGKTRLPGFRSGWNRTILVRVGSAYGGLSGKTKTDFGKGNARYVTFLGVLNNVRIDARHTDQVRVATHETQNVVQRGDLLFNGTSETPGDLAMGAVVGAQIENLYLNSFCFGFRVHNKNRHVPLFLAYFFRGSAGRRLMNKLSQGATRYNISKKQFLALSLIIPDYEEQLAIAGVLSDMDAEIAALERRVDKTRAVKQGMMQQLLTGRVRLVESAATAAS